ncbi:MAG: hypothetical protein CL569_12700 [Alphaproteobacteria bacterium]|nr:hypothetical protein [Alphaproteobacteria bacterium]
MKSVYRAFLTAAERFPDNSFLCVPRSTERDYLTEGLEQSYGEVAIEVELLRRRYEDAGYGKGYRVAILLGNRPEFLLHYMALNAIGVSIVPVNPDYRHAELSYLLDHSETSLVICSADRAADMDAAITRRTKQPPTYHGGP